MIIRAFAPLYSYIAWQTFKTGVGKLRAATRCRSLKNLLPGCAASRPNWSKSDWNDWHNGHAAGATDHRNPYRSEHLIAAKQAHYFIEGRSAK